MNKEIRNRISKAVDEAELAFWKTICEHFPEAETGNLDPFEAAIFSTRCDIIATRWVATNTDLIPEDSEK